MVKKLKERQSVSKKKSSGISTDLNFGLIEAPLFLELEQIGKVVLSSGASRAMKLLPLSSALRSLIAKLTGRQTDRDAQDKIDGRHVITVRKAIEIVREQASKLTEAADVANVLFPAPGTENILSLADRIAIALRKAALTQDKPEILVKGPHRTRKLS